MCAWYFPGFNVDFGSHNAIKIYLGGQRDLVSILITRIGHGLPPVEPTIALLAKSP